MAEDMIYAYTGTLPWTFYEEPPTDLSPEQMAVVVPMSRQFAKDYGYSVPEAED